MGDLVGRTVECFGWVRFSLFLLVNSVCGKSNQPTYLPTISRTHFVRVITGCPRLQVRNYGMLLQELCSSGDRGRIIDLSSRLGLMVYAGTRFDTLWSPRSWVPIVAAAYWASEGALVWWLGRSLWTTRIRFIASVFLLQIYGSVWMLIRCLRGTSRNARTYIQITRRCWIFRKATSVSRTRSAERYRKRSGVFGKWGYQLGSLTYRCRLMVVILLNEKPFPDHWLLLQDSPSSTSNYTDIL